MTDTEIVFFTDGITSLWSDVMKTIRITDMKIAYRSGDFGELRVYFNFYDWCVDRDGLIYTDASFMRCLRYFLDRHGLPGKAVSYSEQGIQGVDYVSCDVSGHNFMKLWGEKGLHLPEDHNYD